MIGCSTFDSVSILLQYLFSITTEKHTMACQLETSSLETSRIRFSSPIFFNLFFCYFKERKRRVGKSKNVLKAKFQNDCSLYTLGEKSWYGLGHNSVIEIKSI